MFRYAMAAIATLMPIEVQARLAISLDPTVNVTCSQGVCSATSRRAVLNANDLIAILDVSDAKVVAGSAAKDIQINAEIGWTNSNGLTLDAKRSVTIEKPVKIMGTGPVMITTNDGGKHGVLNFTRGGNIEFSTTANKLTLDGKRYGLVQDIVDLATNIAIDPTGNYALARTYDATPDGIYQNSPVAAEFNGRVEGLGNTISNVSISTDQVNTVGLFSFLGPQASVHNLGIVHANIKADHFTGLGILAGGNEGNVFHCWTSGTVGFRQGDQIGGLLGLNAGTVGASYANVSLRGAYGALENVGGLTGHNTGSVLSSYALGSVSMRHESGSSVGGLVGLNDGNIADTFSRNRINDGKKNISMDVGGLAGQNGKAGAITTSYAAGKLVSHGGAQSFVGGLIGFDASAFGSIDKAYWDTDLGISDPDQGAGNRAGDQGIQGLTTTQMQAGLPRGFDPTIWGQKATINDAFPYLAILAR